jgi:hypothetical protein
LIASERRCGAWRSGRAGDLLSESWDACHSENYYCRSNVPTDFHGITSFV